MQGGGEDIWGSIQRSSSYDPRISPGTPGDVPAVRIFDVDSEHEDHSEELLLFVGCIVNFIVSYLICMFQDSVPAGSYNDPFLSSVCDLHVI